MKKALKTLVWGMVTLVPTFQVQARFYVGGQFGMTNLSSKRTKTLKAPSVRLSQERAPTQIVDMRKQLERTAFDLSRNIGFMEGRNVLFYGDDGGPWCFGLDPNMVDLERVDHVPPARDEQQAKEFIALTGVGDADSAFRNFMNAWFDVVDLSLERFGFNKLDRYSGETVLIPASRKKLGRIRDVILPANPVTHPSLPRFCVGAFSPVKAKRTAQRVEWIAVDPRQEVHAHFGRETFKDRETLLDACYEGLIADVPGNLERAIVREREALLSRFEDGYQAVDGVEMEKTSKHLSLAVVGGWDRVFFSSRTASFGKYVGLEAFQRFNFGKVDLPNPPTGSFVTQSETSLKTRYVLGVSALPGIASRNGWVFYVPLTVKVTRHSFDFTKAKAGDRGCEFLQKLGDGDFSTKANSTWSDHTAKWNFGGEMGLGSRVQVSKTVSVGVRYSHSFASKVELESPAYDSVAYGDVERFGLHQDVKLREHGVAVEFLYRF